MFGIWQIYKRFFGGLKLALLLSLALVAAESTVPFIVAALGRYTVDEVLEVGLLAPKNQLAEVPSRSTDTVVLDRGRLGRTGPVRVAQSSDRVSGGRAVIARDNADQLAIGAELSERPAELREDLLLRRGKSRAHKTRLLLIVFAFTMIVYVVHSVVKMIHKYILGKVGEQVVFRIRRAMHAKLQRLPMVYHDQHEKGKLMARSIDDVNVVRRMSVHLSTMLTINSFTIVIGIVVIMLINVKLAVLALVSIPLFAVVWGRFRIHLREVWRYLAKQRAGIYGLAGDRLSSPETVKGFGQERRETIRLFKRAKNLLTAELRQVWLAGFLGLWRTVVCSVSIVVVLGYGMLMVRDGQMSMGYLLFFYGSLAMMYMPVANIAQMAPAIQRFRISASRVLDVLDEPVTIRSSPQAVDLPSVAGLIRMENVSLCYKGSEAQALTDINLTIEPGQQVCLMGPSGAGKTSLVNLLLRLYEPTAGAIHLDGRDLREIGLSSLRKHMAYVPQDAFLFSGPLRDNIRYGSFIASNEEVEEAAKAAELHDFVMTLPEGYDTIVGERGVTLSGGQRQRVSLARALLTDPRVLILDDCTSALDTITEARIIKTLRRVMSERTTIVITHRVSMSSRADMIMVLNDGMVAETGSHRKLLSTKGIYHNLVVEQLAQDDLNTKSQRILSAAG